MSLHSLPDLLSVIAGKVQGISAQLNEEPAEKKSACDNTAGLSERQLGFVWFFRKFLLFRQVNGLETGGE